MKDKMSAMDVRYREAKKSNASKISINTSSIKSLVRTVGLITVTGFNDIKMLCTQFLFVNFTKLKSMEMMLLINSSLKLKLIVV